MLGTRAAGAKAVCLVVLVALARSPLSHALPTTTDKFRAFLLGLPSDTTVRTTGTAADRFGNTFILGTTTQRLPGGPSADQVDPTAHALGGRDGFVARLGVSGMRHWLRAVGTRGDDDAVAIAVSDLAVFVGTRARAVTPAGATWTYGLVSALRRDTGHEIWSRAFGESSASLAVSDVTVFRASRGTASVNDFADLFAIGTTTARMFVREGVVYPAAQDVADSSAAAAPECFVARLAQSSGMVTAWVQLGAPGAAGRGCIAERISLSADGQRVYVVARLVRHPVGTPPGTTITTPVSGVPDADDDKPVVLTLETETLALLETHAFPRAAVAGDGARFAAELADGAALALAYASKGTTGRATFAVTVVNAKHGSLNSVNSAPGITFAARFEKGGVLETAVSGLVVNSAGTLLIGGTVSDRWRGAPAVWALCLDPSLSTATVSIAYVGETTSDHYGLRLSGLAEDSFGNMVFSQTKTTARSGARQARVGSFGLRGNLKKSGADNGGPGKAPGGIDGSGTAGSGGDGHGERDNGADGTGGSFWRNGNGRLSARGVAIVAAGVGALLLSSAVTFVCVRRGKNLRAIDEDRRAEIGGLFAFGSGGGDGEFDLPTQRARDVDAQDNDGDGADGGDGWEGAEDATARNASARSGGV